MFSNRMLGLFILAVAHFIAVPAAAGVFDVMKLNRAAQKDNVERLRELLAEGADPNAMISGGQPPLFFAAHKGKLDAAKVLVEAGANLDHSSDDGRTPLIVAATFGHPQMVEWLLEGGADVNSVTRDGWTPLMRAAQRGDTETVRLLLDRNAWTNPKNSEGHDAFKLADNTTISGLLQGVGRRGGTSPQTPTNASHSSSTGSASKSLKLATSEPGVNIILRQDCSSPLLAIGFASGNPFYVDIDLTTHDRLLDFAQFLALVNQTIKTVKEACPDDYVISKMELSITAPEYSSEAPAATAVYRQGYQVYLETHKAETLTVRNYLFAERTRSAFREENGVEIEPQLSEIVGNPFLFQDKAIALVVSFMTMETPDTGRFRGVSGEIFISRLPVGLFRIPNQKALIAARVTGKGSIGSSSESLPTLEFIGSYLCIIPDCSELKSRRELKN